MSRRSVGVAWVMCLILAWTLAACDAAGTPARDPTATPLPVASFTPLPTATSTRTPAPTATYTPPPSATPTVASTSTPTTLPMSTSTPRRQTAKSAPTAPAPTSPPVPTSPPATRTVQGIPGWEPRPIRVDCTLLGDSCVFIITVTVSEHHTDYYHAIELVDESGNSFILGSEIVFANFVAVSHWDLRNNLAKGIPYRWRVVLRRASDQGIVARGQWSTDTYVQQ